MAETAVYEIIYTCSEGRFTVELTAADAKSVQDAWKFWMLRHWKYGGRPFTILKETATKLELKTLDETIGIQLKEGPDEVCELLNCRKITKAELRQRDIKAEAARAEVEKRVRNGCRWTGKERQWIIQGRLAKRQRKK